MATVTSSNYLHVWNALQSIGIWTCELSNIIVSGTFRLIVRAGGCPVVRELAVQTRAPGVDSQYM